VYKDDPTIYAISLVNEPRCDGYTDPACNGYVQDWLEEMAAYVKTVDSKHMLTIGNEGFFAGADKAENPVLWGDSMGQDFTKNGAVPEVDFVTIHMWPDNWDL
jgi:mannan endo-1,4-beta-mannosidase